MHTTQIMSIKLKKILCIVFCVCRDSYCGETKHLLEQRIIEHIWNMKRRLVWQSKTSQSYIMCPVEHKADWEKTSIVMKAVNTKLFQINIKKKFFGLSGEQRFNLKLSRSFGNHENLSKLVERYKAKTNS